MNPTALIADDDEVPRAQLLQALRAAWPELSVVAECTTGGDAWDAFLEREPDICFLDVRMPGLTGIEVAQRIGPRAHVVFVTTLGDHALASFEAGGFDHILKPIDRNQFAEALARLRRRLADGAPPAGEMLPLLDQLAKRVRKPVPLEVIQAGVGHEARLLPVHEVVYFEADARYTRAVLRQGDALVRTPLKDLLPQLDARTFRQIGRTLVVNQHEIACAARTDAEHMQLTLHGRAERLEVARLFQGGFAAS